MSVTIEEVTIGTLEKRLVLSNAQWAATLTLGTNWDRIRIAGRICMDDTGANVTGTPRFYFGMCSDPTSSLGNGPLSGAATKHFVGMISSDTDWARIAAPTPVAYLQDGNVVGKKVGSTITSGTSGAFRVCASPLTDRIVHMVEIEKGSPNFTVRVGAYASAPVDQSITELLTSLDNPTMSAAVGPLTQSEISGTVAVDEATDGFLNAMCVAWDRASTTMHISEMFYAKYA